MCIIELKGGFSEVMNFHGARVDDWHSSPASQELVCIPYLLLITFAHSMSCSLGNLHSHFATKALFLAKRLPISKPPLSLGFVISSQATSGEDLFSSNFSHKNLRMSFSILVATPTGNRKRDKKCTGIASRTDAIKVTRPLFERNPFFHPSRRRVNFSTISVQNSLESGVPLRGSPKYFKGQTPTEHLRSLARLRTLSLPTLIPNSTLFSLFNFRPETLQNCSIRVIKLCPPCHR
ncbi:hypothetical protein Scep_022045 [Stephania cephalantha]|uniref:Uncharacterized protein n=1 Tax=Stephania cephalantha TaxID=152367 RepID=A0AAP0F4L3_9MAGN